MDRLVTAGHATIEGVAALNPEQAFGAGNVRLDFTAAATQPQKDAAASALAAFDWTDPAQASVDTANARNLAVLFLADPAGTYKLLRAAFDVARDEVNILRAIVVGKGSATWDPASIANGAGLTSPTFTITGAAFGDHVLPAAPYTLQGLTATASVSAANTVVVRLENQTGAAVNLASGTWEVTVLRYAAMPPRTLTQFRTAITSRIGDGTVDT